MSSDAIASAPHDFVSNCFTGSDNSPPAFKAPADVEWAPNSVLVRFRTDAPEGLLRESLRVALSATAVVKHRQLHVLQRGRTREEIEALEHEADLLIADRRELVLAEALDADAV